MPAQNVYLSEEQYVKLVHLAMKRGVKVTVLVQEAVADYLKEKEASS